MINKDFIPYQEALELKQLGFDEPCFGVYATKDGYVRKSSYDENGDAPTYSQAFRWFREKHGLCIVIKPIDDKKLDLGYNLLKNGLIMNAHLTYEKAELACLKKLIEIVKEKQK
jgi:hypothetical protein